MLTQVDMLRELSAQGNLARRLLKDQGLEHLLSDGAGCHEERGERGGVRGAERGGGGGGHKETHSAMEVYTYAGCFFIFADVCWMDICMLTYGDVMRGAEEETLSAVKVARLEFADVF